MRFDPGDPIPHFTAATASNPRFAFYTVAGRHVVLCLFGSLGVPAARRILDDFLAARAVFDDGTACFFGVTIDPEDVRSRGAVERLPGVRFFHDFEGRLSHRLGALDAPLLDDLAAGVPFRPFTLILDRRLRVLHALGCAQPESHAAQILGCLRTAIADDRAAARDEFAPVLVVPRVFEPALCRRLIDYFECAGAKPSGFMREVEGKTVPVNDDAFKRRFDVLIEDKVLLDATRQRIETRLRPEIAKAFQFTATRIERFLIARYDASGGGFFRPHLDNTTKGTQHRRFAVTINLNAEEYAGGDLGFPEFGSRPYRAPTGGAVVFSCSLLHEAMPVTQGQRYVFLPFLYDEAAARIREANNPFLAADVAPYRRADSGAQASEADDAT